MADAAREVREIELRKLLDQFQKQAKTLGGARGKMLDYMEQLKVGVLPARGDSCKCDCVTPRSWVRQAEETALLKAVQEKEAAAPVPAMKIHGSMYVTARCGANYLTGVFLLQRVGRPASVSRRRSTCAVSRRGVPAPTF